MLLSLVAFAVAQSADIPILKGLGVSGVSIGARAPTGIDTVQSQIVDGTWKEPHAGDKVPGARGGERTWAEVAANKDGVFEGGPTQGGYVYATVESDVEKPMLLAAAGDSMVYINGEPRGGDPYSYGWLKLPFLMKKGHNTFLFSCGRGRLQAKLEEPKASAFLNSGDVTLPDVISGDKGNLFGAVPVVNATGKRRSLWIDAVASDSSGAAFAVDTSQVIVEPYSVRKAMFGFRQHPKREGDVRLELRLRDESQSAAKPGSLDQLELQVPLRKATDHYKCTFLSAIDGSVQYYAVAPSLKPNKSNALILTVHGASVEATGQANAYKSKDWCTIVAATNRRPYGFDWEDWGRMDAMEVWKIAKKEFPHDPLRQILTGHSMGGHGTWQLGFTYPNEFAAIGPSAGWISFWSYAGGWEPREPNAVEQMLRRSMNQSDTLLMLRNSLNEDVYILHGDKDDNVPVEQAREMKKHLTDVGAKFEYHEEPGAGHWWGDQCVDWPPMFALFQKARIGIGAKTPLEFTTLNPAVSSRYGFLTITRQIHPLLPSRIHGTAKNGEISIETENVDALAVDGGFLHAFAIKVDGVELPRLSTGSRDATFERRDGTWVAVSPDARLKSPERSGPFKLAFQNRFALVVGTRGTAEENLWARNKARFDAEQWYYRGNGAFDIVTDEQARRDPNLRQRNLILLGNADTNSAFGLLKNCPIQVKRGSIAVGDHHMAGQDAVALYLFPEGKRLIGVVGGTGTSAYRLADRLPYFTSGVAYPDWTIMRSSVLREGTKRVMGAGFFGNDWKFDPKQSAFLDE